MHRGFLRNLLFGVVLGPLLLGGLVGCTGSTGPEQAGGSPSGSDDARPADCSVSAILVPACGAWWGSSQVPGTTEAAQALEVTVGQQPPIAHFYARDGEVIPTADQIALTRQGEDPPTLFINLKPEWIAPGTTISWRDVADGGADTYLDQIASSIIELDRPMFLTLHHEPEDDVATGPESGYTAQDYVAMYRHVVERIDSLIQEQGGDATPRPVWVWDVTGYPQWRGLWPKLYPGDDVVDWIAYDPYVQDPHGCDFSCVANHTYAEFPHWDGFYSWAQQMYPNKPLMLGEWGVVESTRPDSENAKADLFRSVPEVLTSSFPDLRALVYFNDDKPTTNPTASRIDSSPQSLQAFQDMIADPYFSPPPG